jgi:uncharacterized LabA/DUF88 family protein
VSKNVAVFVDVANIFYAAKAAGIDIDYVTLLKSATAGRDFVRAYAYTGLDPENENQRQFHSFLARSGYKVISKDIRKYGDGRIKANLDIELVVDMMKTARNLDIAVVVSGDGDFAPAIRAVQEQGVRVEVISFRGNTSSDLIEVADLFTDIAQIARVEKGSARSGRRVAAEGDLSMTEVPDKETEGAPRRRRGGRMRDDRPETPAAGGAGRSSNLIVLPGERLSRGVGDEAAAVGEGADGADLDELVEVGDGETGEYAGSENGAAADAGRRRRRRGGRGRGRGRGRDSEEFAATGATSPAGEDEEDDDLDELPPAQPPAQTFGSVWDSQIGVPSSSPAASAGSYGSDIAEDDEDLDEPEVPEYLLAERRQRGRQGGNRPGGRQPRGRSAYQAALDRERYGNRPPQPSFGGSSPNQSGGRPDRNRDRGGRSGRPQQGGRPYDRAPRQDARPMTGEPRSAEPWSEVPPEVEEMLRAEMARKAPISESRSVTSPATSEAHTPPAAFSAAPDDEQQTPAAKPARRTRSTKATSAAATSAAASSTDAAVDEAPAEAKPKRKAATRSTKSTSTRSKSTKAAAADDSAEPASADAAAEAPKKTTRRRTTKAAAEAPAEES